MGVSQSIVHEVIPDDRLAPFFPRVYKECNEPAQLFFDCYTRESELSLENGLKLCLKEKKSYESCMQRHSKNKKLIKYRVSYYRYLRLSLSLY